MTFIHLFVNNISGSIEQSPRMSHLHYEPENNFAMGSGENQLREDLADAMKDSSCASILEGGMLVFKFYNFDFTLKFIIYGCRLVNSLIY